MAYQPGDWLSGVALARGRLEASEVVSHKKSRAHRQRSDSGGQNDGKRYTDQEMREMRDTKLGRRRYRRWANDNMLRELAPTLTASEIGNLFAPPPWGDKSVQSPLETVMVSSRDMAIWEPFRNNVDMDLQAKVLHQGVPRKAVGELGMERRQSPAMKAWSGVERNMRAALRRNYASAFLMDLEEKLVPFIEGDDQDLVVSAVSTYDRLLVHGSSQFHGLKSITLQVPVAATGSEMETCILIKKTEKALSNVNLPQFLKKLKEKDIAAAA
ncbi:uncharacterized protein [Physcomitrium patens]|uniref:R3H-associated N-terminal domain-containing protein n=2 Tax=Physcomitrium patens TaxID=3218 RepID=A9ST65_PHYPA|nr:uncharacterized protein LOC112281395 isoform X1 [Physcomitrium patens]PNR55964.1 hypothetical protein PHYPA_006861 [Physcomitrium patens]|eukprot:XP_024373627.1 uncharacterized protein LOC112281395 isoform X1 [Physcomitrella patens]